MKHNQERIQQMQELVDQWEQSNKSQRAFSEEHNINYYTFRYWIEKFNRKQSTEGFVQLENKNTVDTSICLRYPNGVELLLPTQTAVKTLKGLIKI